MKTETDKDAPTAVGFPCILGIDPGLAHCGWGLISWKTGTGFGNPALKLLACGEIQTSSKQALALRLDSIYRELNEVYLQYQPIACAVEELYFNKNSSSALPVAHARGIALLCAAQHQVPVQEFSANRIKQSVTGYGKAAKQQVQEMVAFLLGHKTEFGGSTMLEKCGKTNKPAKPVSGCIDTQLRSDHAADALAAAICLVHQSGLQADGVAVPKNRRDQESLSDSAIVQISGGRSAFDERLAQALAKQTGSRQTEK